jgi:small subunit ribosomal protein S21
LPSEIEAGRSGFGAGFARWTSGIYSKGVGRLFMQIIVRDNNVDQALRALKKKLQREGVYREMKLRRHYEKPSEKRARERAAAIRRARKLERKRIEREGAR